MPNPLIIFVVIIGIDLFLNTMKGKKKKEKARRESTRGVGNQDSSKLEEPSSEGPIRGLRRMLEEELEKGKENKRQTIQEKDRQDMTRASIEKESTREQSIRIQKEKINKHSELENMKRRKEELKKQRIKEERKDSRDQYKTPVKQTLVAKTEEDKRQFKEDILKGIIFSEVLGKPKSLRK